MSYNYKKDRENIVSKAVKKYGSLESAIFEMNAVIARVRGENMALQEVTDWEKDYEEHERVLLEIAPMISDLEFEFERMSTSGQDTLELIFKSIEEYIEEEA
tara:strand:+ start:1074 stop:1379 length:306 start_codon:yes stop_codon:yes gene_type:complete